MKWIFVNYFVVWIHVKLEAVDYASLAKGAVVITCEQMTELSDPLTGGV